MYHSVYFGNINTFSDWHLVPDGRPVIAQPEPKITTVEIPGGQGVLDLSEALTNYPLYSNRTGTLTFNVLNGYGDWKDTYQTIANYLHGKQKTLKLEDDPNWYYQGRFKVSWESPNDGTWSKVNIEYDLEPFKYATDLTSISITGTTNGTKNTTINSSNLGSICAPIIPYVSIATMSSTKMVFSVENPELGITHTTSTEEISSTGDSYLYSLILSNMSGSNSCIFRTVTTGTRSSFSLNFRKAAL